MHPNSETQDTRAPRQRRVHVPPNLPGYVTEPEKARMFGEHPITARRARLAGNCPPYVMHGVTVFYRVAGIEQWLRDREINPSTPAKLTRRSRKAGA